MSERRWLWIDVETTGLGYDSDRPQVARPDVILEIAAVITTPDLVEVDSFGPQAIRTDEAALESMGDFVREMHTRTGLLQRLREERSQLPPMREVDEALSAWLTGHGLVEKVLLAGSSVKLDFDFVRRCMPLSFSHLGYRVIDVSSFKEAIRDWAPAVFEAALVEGEPAHEAMADIRGSIKELAAYRRHMVFLDPAEVSRPGRAA